MEHYFTNNEELESKLRTINYRYQNIDFSFTSDNGVFAKNKIDFGSRLLVDTILKYNMSPPNAILDVGCGYGFMGIVLAKILNSKVTLIDINKRAVHLAKMNIKSNLINGEAFVSDIYENINDKYDLIATNPPIRAGKKVVLQILNEAKNYLTPNGELWFVIRKDQGSKSIIKNMESTYKVEILEKDKGFYIMRAKMS